MNRVVSMSTEYLMPLISELLDGGHAVRMKVTGMSMFPFLSENGDYVELERIPYEKLCVGDIALIRRVSGEYVLHRVCACSEETFYILGDAQVMPEGPLAPGQLMAIATAVLRQGRRMPCTHWALRFQVRLWLMVRRFRPRIMRCFHSVFKKAV